MEVFADKPLIDAMADEIGKFVPELASHSAWMVAAGLLAGYRLGDPAAAMGLVANGEVDCRRLVREALVNDAPAEAARVVG